MNGTAFFLTPGAVFNQCLLICEKLWPDNYVLTGLRQVTIKRLPSSDYAQLLIQRMCGQFQATPVAPHHHTPNIVSQLRVTTGTFSFHIVPKYPNLFTLEVTYTENPSKESNLAVTDYVPHEQKILVRRKNEEQAIYSY